jgi:hypothetical protein
LLSEKAQNNASQKFCQLATNLLEEVELKDSVAINFNQGVKNILISFLFNALLTSEPQGIKHLGGCLNTFGGNIDPTHKRFLTSFFSRFYKECANIVPVT